MFSFDFATANRIIFGAGKLNELRSHIQAGTRRVLLVRGRSADAIPRVREIFSAAHIPFAEFEVRGEPTLDVVRQGMEAARDCDMLVGLGGGSALDTGKAI